ncbi:esterase-like activity of phytase family protein [Actinoplanes solisilvae]|uniref:esterase-like activity of phytase family protein n=1 Tax=Actinoplanes solisilvae TaxID=2486853 RepID=UPI001F0C2D39|nr:esterase-like activity of phytase family protein [Actinoplanes solisilvae]
MDELSGLVAVDNGYAVVNDGSDFANRRRIFFLNSSCRVTRTVPYPSRPRDPEDLGRAGDGSLWIADIGDNGRSRTTVALWKLAPRAKSPVLYRLTYPDGAHDAEALLVSRDGSPIIVTKSGGTAGLYAPARALSRDKATPLRLAGEVTVPLTTTSNPFSFLGRAVITGAAASPDGRHVALRTYADAFEYDVDDGDVIKALTTSKPRQIPLPDEPQGESITYSADGRSLLTVSESSGQPAGSRPVLLRYPLPDRPAATATPSAPPTPSPTVSEAPAAPNAPNSPAQATKPAAEPTTAAASETTPFNYIAVIVGVVVLLGVALAAILVLRRRRE